MAYIDTLDRSTLFSTRNIDQAESFLKKSVVDGQFVKVPQPRHFEFHCNSVPLEKSVCLCTRYMSQTEIESGTAGIPVDSIYLIMGSAVPSEFVVGGKSLITSLDHGIVLTPGKKIRAKRPAGSEIFVLSVDRTHLERLHQTLADRNSSRSIEFESGVDLSKGPGLLLRQVANRLLEDLAQDKTMLERPAVKNGYSMLLLNAVLLLPHSLTEAEQHRILSIAPKTVRKAEEYMRANLSELLTIADLLAVCQCSRNALFESFRRTRGYSPMAFLEEQRLQKVRQRIQKSGPDTSLSRLAHECGFTHLGRFARAYRQRFGELPSETPRLV